MNARKQHHLASEMEIDLSEIAARADALLLVGLQIGEEHDERDGAAICQLARDFRRHARKMEKRRSKLAKALHPAAYPNGIREPAGTMDPN